MFVLRQPSHRRPSFMQTPSAVRTYLVSDFSRKKGLPMGSERESFSYNPKHLDDWSIPPDLAKTLPPRLMTELEGWRAAGAAVSTILRRLERFDDESMYRGWPVKKTEHLSRAASIGSDPQSPYQGPLPSPSNSASVLFAAESHQPLRLPHLTTCLSDTSTFSEAVSDTPPFTPDDARIMPLTHVVCSGRPSIDPLQLNERLEPLTEHKMADFTSSPPLTGSPMPMSPPILPQFDEGAWEFFVRQYEAELDSLRIQESVRFRHMRRGIEMAFLELQRDQTIEYDFEWKTAFSEWWVEMGVKQEEVEKEIQELEMPRLEHVKLERVAQGLVI